MVTELPEPTEHERRLLANWRELYPEFEEPVLIARGGYASVFRAQRPRPLDPNRWEAVAIKLFGLQAESERAWRHNEEDMARADELDDDARPASLMPYLSRLPSREWEGRRLEGLVAPYYEETLVAWRARFGSVARPDRPPIPLADLLTLIDDVAEGLDHLHERGLVHHDVKPSNIFIHKGARAVVGDFGCTRHEGEATVSHTPTFAPPVPEIDRQADAYSLALVIAYLILGDSRVVRSQTGEHLVYYPDWRIGARLRSYALHAARDGGFVEGVDRGWYDRVSRTCLGPGTQAEPTLRPDVQTLAKQLRRIPPRRHVIRDLWVLSLGLLLIASVGGLLWITPPEPAKEGPQEREKTAFGPDGKTSDRQTSPPEPAKDNPPKREKAVFGPDGKTSDHQTPVPAPTTPVLAAPPIEPGELHLRYTIVSRPIRQLRVYRARVTTTDVGNQRASDLLLNALNARYPGQFARSPGDGKWLMNIKHHTHEVPVPQELRGLKVRKHGPGVTHATVHRARIVGKRKLDVEVRCWSSPTHFDITATVWGPQPTSTKQTQTVSHDGRELRFTLPEHATDAEIQIQIGGNPLTFRVGDPVTQGSVSLRFTSRIRVTKGWDCLYTIEARRPH